jgi:TPR repeat protein
MKNLILLGLLTSLLMKPSPASCHEDVSKGEYEGKSDTELREMADAGDAAAQFIIGHEYDSFAVYKFGWQERASYYRRALILYRRAAEQGHVEAMVHLATLYNKGELADVFNAAEALSLGIEPQAASFWFRKAADQGDADAQNDLGALYVNGEGVAKDYATAINWFRKAAEQGLADAQFNLGAMYFNGYGLAKDVAIAISWWRKAADQGLYNAQRRLGFAYATGTGVTKDHVQALKWATLASWQGINSPQTWKYARDLEGKMTPGQIAQAKQLAKEWVKK